MKNNLTDDVSFEVKIPGSAEDSYVLRMLGQRMREEGFAPIPGSRTHFTNNYDKDADTTYGRITYIAYEEPSGEAQPNV